MRKIEDDDLKFHEFYDVLLQWLHVMHEGRTIAEYLAGKGYRKIAILRRAYISW